MGIFSKWFSSKKQQDGTISVTPQMPQFSAVDYCEQGQKMLNEGKLMQAMEFFQAAIEEDKHFEKAYLLLSEVYEKQGKKDKAKAALYGQLAVDPNNDAVLKRLEQLNRTAQNATSSPIASVGQTLKCNLQLLHQIL